MNSWQEVWTRLLSGQHVVLLGAGPIPEPDAARLRLVRVDCEAFPQPRGTLNEACRRMARQIEVPHPVLELAAERLRAGVRRHLLGEGREGVEAASHLDAFQRAVPAGQPPTALVLSGIDRADSASLELLTRWIEEKSALVWPLLFSFEEPNIVGPAKRLLLELRRRLPPEAFWTTSAPDEAQRGPALSSLPPLVLRVLRAGATIGDRFESEILAQLLHLDELEVLGALQQAADQKLPLSDRGQGVFRLEPSWAEQLRQGILPSLARAWHERLAQLFGGLPVPVSAAAEGTCTDSSSEVVTSLPSVSVLGAAEGTCTDSSSEVVTSLPSVSVLGAAEGTCTDSSSERSSPAPVPEPAATPATATAASVVTSPLGPEPALPPPLAAAATPAPQEWFEGKQPPVVQSDPRQESWWQQLTAELAAARSTPPLVEHGGNEHRSAVHAEAAGLWGPACEQHLAAAERASLGAEHPLALELASRALALGERLEDREQRRQLQVRALLVVGRSRWQHHDPGQDSTLQAAMGPLLQCRALTRESDPPELRAELGSLIANVQYDIGTPAALELALHELTRASQLLLEAGRPLDAARLLNDEAAVWVKIGDPVRANHLLSNSRAVFAKVAGSYPAARVELLETEHLLARLLLHAQPRPGREQDALQLGIEHGRAAEEGYRELNARRQLGRVWETLGRLELRLDHLDAAARLLEDARQLQAQLGDGLGLARSSGALCELLIRTQNYPLALERLAESIALNAQKGSRAGLEFNLASFSDLQSKLPPALHDAAGTLERRLRNQLS